MRRALSVYEQYRLQVPSNQTSSESFIVRKLQKPDFPTARSERTFREKLTREKKIPGIFSRSYAPARETRRQEVHTAHLSPSRSTATVRPVRLAKPKKRPKSRTKRQKAETTSASNIVFDSATELIATHAKGSRKEKQKEEQPVQKPAKKTTTSKSAKLVRTKPRAKSAAVLASKPAHAPVRSPSCLGYPVLESLHVDSDVINAVGAANVFDSFDRCLVALNSFMFNE